MHGLQRRDRPVVRDSVPGQSFDQAHRLIDLSRGLESDMGSAATAQHDVTVRAARSLPLGVGNRVLRIAVERRREPKARRLAINGVRQIRKHELPPFVVGDREPRAPLALGRDLRLYALEAHGLHRSPNRCSTSPSSTSASSADSATSINSA
jgi:hypothetical protein